MTPAEADAYFAQLVAARAHVPEPETRPVGTCLECEARPGHRCSSECLANTTGTRRIR